MALDRQMHVASGAVRDGRLFIADRRSFDSMLGRWEDCAVVIRLEQVLDPRSVVLNAFYWGVVIDAVSESTGYEPPDAHAAMKALHLSPRLHAMRGGASCWQCGRVLEGSTRGLSGLELWRYIERIQRWAAFDGVVIPDPEAVV